MTLSKAIENLLHHQKQQIASLRAELWCRNLGLTLAAAASAASIRPDLAGKWAVFPSRGITMAEIERSAEALREYQGRQWEESGRRAEERSSRYLRERYAREQMQFEREAAQARLRQIDAMRRLSAPDPYLRPEPEYTIRERAEVAYSRFSDMWGPAPAQTPRAPKPEIPVAPAPTNRRIRLRS